MSFVAIKSKFHVALDGVGLILQGAPDRPGYAMKNSPVYGNRFASGDRDYNDFSQWWYLTQTDWSGGFKDTISFADDVKFYYSSNVDVRTKPGSIRLERQIAQVYDNNGGGNDEILHVGVLDVNGSPQSLVMTNTVIKNLAGTTRYNLSAGSFRTMFSHKGYFWGSNNLGSVVGYSNSVAYPVSLTVNPVANINGIISGSMDGQCAFAAVGGTLYLIGTSNDGTIFVVKTTVTAPAVEGDWTLVTQFPEHNNLSAQIVGAEVLGDEIIFLVDGSPLWALYSLDIATGIATLMQEFDNTATSGDFAAGARFVTKFGVSKLLITIKKDSSDAGEGEIWTYDGTTLAKVYSTNEIKKGFSTLEAIGHLGGGCTVYGDYAFWGNLVMDSSGKFFNFIKNYTDETGRQLMPIGQDGDKMYMVDDATVSSDTQTYLYSYDKSGSTYKDGSNNEAYLIFSQHDKIQSIDKLLNSITIGFDKFVSGQTIRVYYSTNLIPDPNITTGSWTLLGTASHTLDGASVVFKNFLFPVGIIAKKVWFRVELASAGSDTPSINDFTLEYLPMPDYKKQWSLTINCADDLKRLDGALVETTGRELKSRIERSWWTKSQLDFQDLDYATTLANDASFDATETTITVDSTADFPEQGRIRVDDEEITYTGKTPTTFTGCTRGARSTRASTHADDSVVNNAYKVIILDVEERAPILLEDKELEYIVGLQLREV